MNIDDILKQGPFKNEDDFTAEMSKTAGEKVLSRLDETFESRDHSKMRMILLLK